ncbi:MAG TPA: PaaI family thioesterase [Propionibacteriaceae bacterium]|nr:PaaI family thioesterase [Propionibacteriaceae bacterium]
MTTPRVPEWAQQLTSALDDRMGMELVELDAQRVVGRMPVEGNTQPYGILHGGASCVLVEGLGSMGALCHAMGFGKVAVGVDISVTHHRSIREGWVTGVATPIHLGRTIACYEVIISDDADRRLATGRITCQLIDAPRTA